MPKPVSAGVLIFRKNEGKIEVLLVHPGGPFWSKKDLGVWSIPKGQVEDSSELLDNAIREFSEETGLPVPTGPFLDLGFIEYKNGKRVYGFAIEKDYGDVVNIKSNTVEIEVKKGSGKYITIPEVDRAEYFEVGIAKQKILAAQAGLIETLEKRV